MASTALPACADHRLTRIMYGSNLHPYKPLVHLVHSRALLWPAGIDAHSSTAGSRTLAARPKRKCGISKRRQQLRSLGSTRKTQKRRTQNARHATKHAPKSRTPPLSTSILASACTWAGRCWPWAILSNTVSAYSDCGSSSSRLRRFRAPPRC